ncbi:MAG: hypothetical protein P9L93_03240 [Candidatus Gorgyraea atricola]|nr:hypothetical protein [Candidatus Gorgyraea atricola]
MDSYKLREHHIKSFSKLSLSERLSWIFAQRQFLSRFMDPEARQISRKIRRNGKKYFKDANLA